MRRIISLFCITLLFFVIGVAAQEATPPNNIVIVLDGSGSMQADLNGQTRLQVAKDSLSTVSAEIPAGANVSLWAYGHRLSQDDPAASCQDIEEIIPLGPFDPGAFQTAVTNLNAIGYTPISDTLTHAAATLPLEGDNTIVLLSDGEETCGGNPCLVAEQLAAQNIELVVNTIGFAADENTRQQLQCIAQVTGGTYYDAQDADALVTALREASETPGTVRIVDPDGNLLSDVPFSLVNPDTDERVGTYRGSAQVPEAGYFVNVPIEPPVSEAIVVLPNEVTDVVVNPTPFGTIALVDTGGNPVADVALAVRNAETDESLGARNSSMQVPPGVYNVTVRTIIPFETQVTVAADEVVQIPVDTSTGTIVSVDMDGNPITGTTFIIDDVETEERLYANNRGSWEVPPGTYDVEVRGLTPFETQVTVAAGETVEVSVETSRGTIVSVDMDGNPITGTTFAIDNVETEERLYTNNRGSWEVPPGTYDIEIRSQLPETVQVTVGAGETVEVPVDTRQGTITLVDSSGEMVTGTTVVIVHQETNTQLYSNNRGSWDVPPGVYDVEIRGETTTELTVTVEEDEIVEISE